MELNKIYHGDCLSLFSKLDNDSIDCVITSPPYWQLRDYGYPEQWGLEPTYNEYLEHLWSMMDEVYRVMKATGTAWINLGDSYARGSRPKDGTNHTVSNAKEIHIEPNTKPDYNGLNKCLLLLPHRFAIGCMDRGWIIRNDIIWAKRNGMPESVTDRFSKKHEYFFLMTKSEKYYFDLNSIKDSIKEVSKKRYEYEFKGTEGGESGNFKGSKTYNEGKNPGTVSDFWDITTKPNSDKHYATFNTELIEKPIVAGCPVGGVILDPFCGTATTGCRALELGRNFIGFEGSEKFVKMGNKNLLPYLSQTSMF